MNTIPKNRNKKLTNLFTMIWKYYHKNKNKGKQIAYARAISIIRSFPEKIINLNQIREVRGIGPRMIDLIDEYLQTGDIAKAHQSNQSTSSKEIVEAMFQNIWGIGPAKAESLYNMGMRTYDDLKRDVTLLTRQQRIGLRYREELNIPLQRRDVRIIYSAFSFALNKKFGRGTYKMKFAGSYRRERKECGDIDCLLYSNNFSLKDVITLFKKKKMITDILSSSPSALKAIGRTPRPSDSSQHYRIDIEFVPMTEWYSSLLYFTGSKNFNMMMRETAKYLGMKLTRHGLFDRNGKAIPVRSERDIFERLAIDYVPPEMRNI